MNSLLNTNLNELPDDMFIIIFNYIYNNIQYRFDIEFKNNFQNLLKFLYINKRICKIICDEKFINKYLIT